ncbi:MAG: FAD-dependent oxidoreductase [Clostridium luticellarii]|uniref:Assimilatory nitrate reductase electron transfer subunit n=1 Tax=Clostridium luticellarii TaxID=1691940 RepID=A0A2T0BSE8_9CLOT|nr:FAD-dependent oxidoreductase [Clostridium luticellarii]MCI1996378.1 FAD-dependent oxidoreductase [Clostridium luticellarii]MCI2040707.1 FAD-dependent oxidoreductase [Clostridium luticellarii]PRR86811.1 Assimilatory nitrate reductase electron transfer subunit [Clostridium luticellarii]
MSTYKFMEKINESSNENSENKPSSSTKKWKCLVCGIIIEGDEPPKTCPVCGADASQFIEVSEKVPSNFSTDKDERFVIIGNGAAGYYAANSIRDRNKSCSIVIISAENLPTYYRPELSDYLLKPTLRKDFYLCNEKWYKDNNIELLLGCSAKNIDTRSKKVTIDTGRELSYDKLILANGSSSFIIPIKGIDKKGVFSLKYKSDAENIKNYMSKSKNAVIIGGGLLGLEAAWSIKNSGLNVTVVEFSDRLLSRQLDSEGAVLFKEAVDKSGVETILGDSAEEILGEEKVSSLRLKSGKIIKTDMVLFSTGIRPNKQLVENTDIKTNRGIIVNDKMETSAENIYACGDICEYNGRVYGNWPASEKMGKIAGANAAGDEVHFSDFVSSSIFTSMNTELFSCGTISPDLQTLSLRDPLKKEYQKLFFENNKLTGGILIGNTKKAGKIIQNIQASKTMQDIIKENFFL